MDPDAPPSVRSHVGDATLDLLQATLPGIGSPSKGYVDEEEDEVFFGKKDDREKNSKNSKFIRQMRRTLNNVDCEAWRQNPKAFLTNDSILEEDEDDLNKGKNVCLLRR